MPLNPDVTKWIKIKKIPLEKDTNLVREIICSVSPKIEEVIKWQAPTFVYKGNIASFFPKAKDHVALMFHTGAKLKDPKGLLEGEGKVGRVARFEDSKDIARKRVALQGLIRDWIRQHEDK